MSYTTLIIPEGVESSDGRSYPPGILTWRDRYEFMFTDKTTEGHMGAVHVGNLENLRRQTVDGVTWIVGDLTYDTDTEAVEAERLAIEDKIRRVSADIAVNLEQTGTDDDGLPIIELVSAEIVGTTQTPMSAFGDARVLVGDEAALVPAVIEPLVAAANPQADIGWFFDPRLTGPTPLHITPEGHVYGHLATWGTCHIAFDGACVTPPTSMDNYGFFHTGIVDFDGEAIPVGHITLGTGHASLSAGRQAATEHYDNTGSCVADVVAGEDDYGIWVSGAVRPGADVDALRSAALSGDWRNINGNLELVAALAVNVPGFPIPRLAARVASGEQEALVASGVVEQRDRDDLIVDALRLIAAKLVPIEEFLVASMVSPPNGYVTVTEPAPTESAGILAKVFASEE